MSIVGQNTLLNQYIPTIYIKDLLDGQVLKYDSTKKAFVNSGGNTLTVPFGGTGLTTLVANQILFGNGTAPVSQDSDLTFVASTNTLTVGTSTLAGTLGGDVTLTATATNADINLIPNGTGAIVIGPAGAGLIESESGQPLTIKGNTTLTVQAGTGNIIMNLSGTTANKLTITGPSAIDYATNLVNENLVNKYYVDKSSAGAIKAVAAIVSLTNITTNIGAALPPGSTILSVKVNVSIADTGPGTLTVGKSGSLSEYMGSADNDTQIVGLYTKETLVNEAGSVQVIATSTGAASGTATILVTYQLAE